MLTTFCSFFFVIENYYSLADIFWRTEVIDKLYYVRSADENVGGSVVDILRILSNVSTRQAVLCTVR